MKQLTLESNHQQQLISKLEQSRASLRSERDDLASEQVVLNTRVSEISRAMESRMQVRTTLLCHYLQLFLLLLSTHAVLDQLLPAS